MGFKKTERKKLGKKGGCKQGMKTDKERKKDSEKRKKIKENPVKCKNS